MGHYYKGHPREPGFVMKHLLGEYSLARSYWLHTVVLGWGLAVASASTLREVGEHGAMRHVAMALIVLQGFAALVWTWSVAGTWMAALRRLFTGGGRLWAVLAMITMGGAILGAIAKLPLLRPDLEDIWAVAQGQQPTPGFDIALRAGGRTLAFQGGINEGAAAALEAQVAASPRVTTLLLDSPGGWIKEGQRMADVVKRHRLNTRVEQGCYSSCTLVLLAGVNRTAGEQAEVGFHRGRPIGQTRRPRMPARAEEAAVYREAGLDADFIQRILTTPNDSIWVPTRAELLAARVLTR